MTTHNDIYTKFMIEYDKANVTSSYPSLTQYEAATILDKAYLILIARKVTGNNTRRVPFEYDTKAIEDLRPLLTTAEFQKGGKVSDRGNEYMFTLPKDLMYYIEGFATYYDGGSELVIPVNHQIAKRFKATNSNIPWIKQPVSYIEGDKLHVLIDTFKHIAGFSLDGTYIKEPKKFVRNENMFGKDIEFELSDTMAEELVTLAVALALENVESPRLQTKLSTMQLEG